MGMVNGQWSMVNGQWSMVWAAQGTISYTATKQQRCGMLVGSQPSSVYGRPMWANKFVLFIRVV